MCLFLIVLLICPFGWLTLVNILQHYGALLSLHFIAITLLIYEVWINLVSSLSLIFLMTFWQYKNHYNEIPFQSTITKQE